MDKNFSKVFKTRDLNFWKKLAQVYWFIPKSMILDELGISDGILSVKTKNGNSFAAPIDEIKYRFQKDSNERREVKLTHGTEKIRFIEIPWMLSDEEWDMLFVILSEIPDSSKSKYGKVTEALGVIRDVIK